MDKRINQTGIILENLDGLRLDQAAAQLFPSYSREKLKQWIIEGKLRLNDRVVKPREKVKATQTLTLEADIEQQVADQPQAIDLDIVYDDESIIVINKPVGLVVHPGAGNPDQTLVNALLHFDPELAKLPRAGIVHRLDKDTSGIMVVARSLGAHKSLVDQLQARTMTREYTALVNGMVVAGGTIDAPIGRHPNQRIKMAVVESGKPAITHYRVAERFPKHTLLNVKLETGRTHQIRVHLAHIKRPIVGDKTYGGKFTLPGNFIFPRQALHAKNLTLIHPETHETRSFSTEIPNDFEELLQMLRQT